MEYLDGKSLADRLAKGAVPLEEALAFANVMAIVTNLGIAFQKLGRYDEAREYLLRALESADRQRLADLSGAVLDNLGSLELVQQQFGAAEAYYRQALALQRRRLPEGRQKW